MLQNTRRDRDSLPSSLLIWCNTLAPWRTISTIRTNGNHRHFFIQIPKLSHVLVYSVDKIQVLVVTVELICCCSWIYIFFRLCSNTKQISYVHKVQKKLSKLHCFFAWCALFKVATFLFFFCRYLPPNRFA